MTIYIKFILYIFVLSLFYLNHFPTLTLEIPENQTNIASTTINNRQEVDSVSNPSLLESLSPHASYETSTYPTTRGPDSESVRRTQSMLTKQYIHYYI